jgi:hypothetical protein
MDAKENAYICVFAVLFVHKGVDPVLDTKFL